MRVLAALVIVIAIVAGGIYFRFGTVEPCGILRVRVREQGVAQRGLNAVLASALPDQAIDTLMAAQYGPLTPGRCLNVLMGPEDALSR